MIKSKKEQNCYLNYLEEVLIIITVLQGKHFPETRQSQLLLLIGGCTNILQCINFFSVISKLNIKGTFFWAYSGIRIVGISQTAIVRSRATLIPEWL